METAVKKVNEMLSELVSDLESGAIRVEDLGTDLVKSFLKSVKQKVADPTVSVSTETIKATELPVPNSPSKTVFDRVSESKKHAGYLKQLAGIRNRSVFMDALAVFPGLDSPDAVRSADHLFTVSEKITDRLVSGFTKGRDLAPEIVAGMKGKTLGVVVGMVSSLWKGGSRLSPEEVSNLSEIIELSSIRGANDVPEDFGNLPRNVETRLRDFRVSLDCMRISESSTVPESARSLWFGNREPSETIKAVFQGVSSEIANAIGGGSVPESDAAMIERSVHSSIAPVFMSEARRICSKEGAEVILESIKAMRKEDRLALTSEIKKSGDGVLGYQLREFASRIASTVFPSLDASSDPEAETSGPGH